MDKGVVVSREYKKKSMGVVTFLRTEVRLKEDVDVTELSMNTVIGTGNILQ